MIRTKAFRGRNTSSKSKKVSFSPLDYFGTDLRNTARGDSHTKLPMMIVRPTYWAK